MKSRGILAALLLLCFIPIARADCECLWQGAFVDVQADTDLVVSGRIVASKGNSVDLSVARTLRGGPHPETIRIWLKTGDLCRPEVDRFPVGSQWTMALHSISEDIPGRFNPGTPNISYGRLGDYSLSRCGGYWLSQSEQFVTGNLIDAPRWEHEPKMSPVLIDLVEAYVGGTLPRSALAQASQEDPALRELMLDTRAFLREEN